MLRQKAAGELELGRVIETAILPRSRPGVVRRPKRAVQEERLVPLVAFQEAYGLVREQLAGMFVAGLLALLGIFAVSGEVKDRQLEVVAHPAEKYGGSFIKRGGMGRGSVVPLTDAVGRITLLPQMLRPGLHPGELHGNMKQRPPAQQHRPAGHADRGVQRTHVEAVRESRPAASKVVQVRRIDLVVAEGAERIVPQIVREEDDDVGPRLGGPEGSDKKERDHGTAMAKVEFQMTNSSLSFAIRHSNFSSSKF